MASSVNYPSEFKIQVINCFKNLQTALADLKPHILDNDAHLPAWFQAPPELFPQPVYNVTRVYRQQIYQFLCQIEYLDEQDPKNILLGSGIVAASEPTLLALERLNTAKDTFKQAMVELKANAPNELSATTLSAVLLAAEELSGSTALVAAEPSLTEPTLRPPKVATSLQLIGLARLHLKQCYRRVPILLQRPKKVSWTWANTRSIKKITVKQAEQMLLKQKNKANLQLQINKLLSLNPNEPIAIVQDLAPHLRANIVMEAAGGDVSRFMLKGTMPIFYLAEDSAQKLHNPQRDHQLPTFIPPGAKHSRDNKRPVRNDVKLEPEPFLPAIRAHRYLNKEKWIPATAPG